MRTRLVYDADELVPLRDYAWEGLAALDQSLLEAGGIPAIIQQNRGGETEERAVLVVRREHASEALEVLDDHE